MRRLPFPGSIGAASAACLLVLGWSVPAWAADGPLDRFVAAWMGVVAVIGADAATANGAELPASGDGDATFAIDDKAGEARRPDGERRPDGDRHAEGRRRHHGDHPHQGAHRGGMHDRGPHHGGMGPGRMGPPGGPDAHHPAMRAFHEIIRRLARIEEKLGIESGPPSGPKGDRQRRPQPEMRPEKQLPRGPQWGGDRNRERLEIPDDVRRQMAERMQEGRRHMEEAKERMEQARKKFEAMQERIKQLEAEVERLKAGK